ncbi:hypothetical protein GGS26DRAFT_210493 [Hypomontagnella submonticulosa]|nr:hypothetical protein GGS26DRAFT_210493 [Hypomontagnella submonticulosa]
MATSISVCRGCTRHIIILQNSFHSLRPSNRTVKAPCWLRLIPRQIRGRPFSTINVRAALPKQKPKVTKATTTPSPPSASPQPPVLSYAQKLADKSSPTTLYEAGPQRTFLFSSYAAGIFFIFAGGVNTWLNVYEAPEGLHWTIRGIHGFIGLAMAAAGTRFALIPAGAIRSIKVLPARSAKTPNPAAKTASSAALPVVLEIEARRSLPFPGMPLRRFQVDPNDVVMKVPMYNRKAAPSDYEKMMMKQQDEAQRKKEREYEMNHLMTAPFRHAGQAIALLFSSFRRGITGEGFAPVTINGAKYKLDITSAYMLEEGRALDRIVRIAGDPALSRLASRTKP